MRSSKAKAEVQSPIDDTFVEIAELIASTKVRAFQAVNTALIELYWHVGGIISRKTAAAEWGEGVVNQLAAYLTRRHPGLRGFTRRNLFRMRQFYDAWKDHELLPAVLAQLSPEADDAGRQPIVPAALAQCRSLAHHPGKSQHCCVNYRGPII